MGIDLGRVTGLSAYEVWVEQPGNEGKTVEEFLQSLIGETPDFIEWTKILNKPDLALKVDLKNKVNLTDGKTITLTNGAGVVTYGGEINLIIPDTSSSWARGYTCRQLPASTGDGSIGFFGTGKTVNSAYIGVGKDSWSSANNLTVTKDKVTFKNKELVTVDKLEWENIKNKPNVEVNINTTNGFIKHNGIIECWGYSEIEANQEYKEINLPITYSDNNYNPIITGYQNSDQLYIEYVENNKIRVKRNENKGVASKFYYRCIGR